MGMFDTFHGICPQCGEEFSAQSKLFELMGETYMIGETLVDGDGDPPFENARLELKDACQECGVRPVAVIEKGTLKAFEIGAPTHKEGLWGVVLGPNDDRDEQARNASEAMAKAIGSPLEKPES